jgi:hypothetical protein
MPLSYVKFSLTEQYTSHDSTYMVLAKAINWLARSLKKQIEGRSSLDGDISITSSQ